jgi:hypothetical protein
VWPEHREIKAFQATKGIKELTAHREQPDRKAFKAVKERRVLLVFKGRLVFRGIRGIKATVAIRETKV